MAQNLNYPVAVANYTFNAIATTTTSTAISVPQAEEYAIVFDCTAATGTSPTCDIVMQTSWDKGTTYINCPLRSAQIGAAGVHWNVMRAGLGWGEAALTQAGVADTGGALNKNFIFDPQYVKFKATIGGTNPAVTVKVHIFAHPLGTRSNN